MKMLKYVADLFADHVGVPGDVRGHRIGVRIMLVAFFKSVWNLWDTSRKHVGYFRSAPCWPPVPQSYLRWRGGRQQCLAPMTTTSSPQTFNFVLLLFVCECYLFWYVRWILYVICPCLTNNFSCWCISSNRRWCDHMHQIDIYCVC